MVCSFCYSSVLCRNHKALIFRRVPVEQFHPAALCQQFLLRLLLLPAAFQQFFHVGIGRHLLRAEGTALPLAVCVQAQHTGIARQNRVNVLLHAVVVILHRLVPVSYTHLTDPQAAGCAGAPPQCCRRSGATSGLREPAARSVRGRAGRVRPRPCEVPHLSGGGRRVHRCPRYPQGSGRLRRAVQA